MIQESTRPFVFVLGAFIVSVAACFAQTGGSITTNGFTQDVLVARLPSGLTLELAAAPPLTRHPMMGSFDDRGRLFVAEAAGVNRSAEELDVEKPNFIRMLVDTNRDGIFDHSTVFADKLTFPSGALWHEGALWVTAAPSIWRLEDTDDDGVADKREEIVTGFGYTGNAADLHGPFLHPNGRIFWCHGRKSLDVYDQDGRSIHKGEGARIWSCESDGSDVQIYAGGGMDNPVEIDFTPEGEIVGTINLMYGRPRGDTLVHWQYGGVYPRYDRETVLAEFTRTGDLLSEYHNFGHVAVSGIAIYRSPTGLGSYLGDQFVAHFNTQKITRTKVERAHATFQHVATWDFLVINDPDVHLTDVMEDADGTLLVIDTGGWVRNGCPTSQIAKPQITGAIYRIRKEGNVDRKSDFRGLGLDWESLDPGDVTQFLGDERFAVRDRAIAELARRGNASLGPLDKILEQGSVDARRNAIWALTRIESIQAMELVVKGLKDSDKTVRHTACNSIWKTRDEKAVGGLVKILLEDKNASVQMAAARALGRIGDPRVVEDLLTYLARPLDRVREHAAIYALMEINDYDATAQGLTSNSPEVQKRVLWALNGMRSSSLGVSQVLQFFDSHSTEVVDTAVAITKFHPEWAAGIATAFQDWRAGNNLTEIRKVTVNRVAPFYLGNEKMRSFVGSFFEENDTASAEVGFDIISQSPQKVPLHVTWSKAIERVLGGIQVEQTGHALDALANIDTRRFDRQLQEIAGDGNRPAMIRIKALGAVSGNLGPMGNAAFALLKKILESGSSASQRMEAATMLATANLTAAQRLEAVALLKHAGPLELPVLMGIYFQTLDAEIGFALVSALESNPAAFSLSPPELKGMLGRYFPVEVFDRAKPLIQKLFDLDGQREGRLAELEPELESGVSSKGREVFNSGKGACISCHSIGGKGREVGPDLSTIGKIRTKRDLLEAIIYPDFSYARDYEPYQIQTVDGQSLIGVIQRETSDTLFVLDATAIIKSIKRSSIKNIQPSPVSMMPTGLDQAMTQEELIHLVAYLDSLK